MAEQAGSTKVRIAKDLITQVSLSDAGIHRKNPRCTGFLSIPVNTVKVTSSEMLSVSRRGICGETPNGDGEDKDTNSGAGSNFVGRYEVDDLVIDISINIFRFFLFSLKCCFNICVLVDLGV